MGVLCCVVSMPRHLPEALIVQKQQDRDAYPHIFRIAKLAAALAMIDKYRSPCP